MKCLECGAEPASDEVSFGTCAKCLKEFDDKKQKEEENFIKIFNEIFKFGIMLDEDILDYGPLDNLLYYNQEDEKIIKSILLSPREVEGVRNPKFAKVLIVLERMRDRINSISFGLIPHDLIQDYFNKLKTLRETYSDQEILNIFKYIIPFYECSDQPLSYHATIVIAVAELYRKHQILIDRDVNERTIAYKLAEILQVIYEGWDVDCEFNRMYQGNEDDAKKTIKNLNPDIIFSKTNECLIYPDIIVHNRNSDFGIMVIELKKQGVNLDQDINKLKHLTTSENAVKYQYGISIILGDTFFDTEFIFFKDGVEVDMMEVAKKYEIKFDKDYDEHMDHLSKIDEDDDFTSTPYRKFPTYYDDEERDLGISPEEVGLEYDYWSNEWKRPDD